MNTTTPTSAFVSIYLLLFVIVISTAYEILRFGFTPVRTIKRWKRNGLFHEQTESIALIRGHKTEVASHTVNDESYGSNNVLY